MPIPSSGGGFYLDIIEKSECLQYFFTGFFLHSFQAIQLLPVIYATKDDTSEGNGDRENWELRCERVIAFCHQSATKLIACSAPDAALRLFLNCTLVIEATPFAKQPHFAYEFFSQVS